MLFKGGYAHVGPLIDRDLTNTDKINNNGKENGFLLFVGGMIIIEWDKSELKQHSATLECVFFLESLN